MRKRYADRGRIAPSEPSGSGEFAPVPLAASNVGGRVLTVLMDLITEYLTYPDNAFGDGKPEG
ncbi:hypothetical protein, partial [Cryobacterium tagatosivorans]|uniref:hypothetical protein n=1 Tax=Cryobacterium tagatosivorans TaxID=1259199 RepID=UPI001A7E31EA